MSNKNFQTYFDCGSSKIRAGSFNKINQHEFFYTESKFFFDQSNIDFEIQKIISLLEENTNEYLDSINLMIDSSEMLSIGISISKKLDGSKLKKEDIQFLIQNAKQEVLRNQPKQNIVHIVVKNYKIDDIEYTSFPDNINCNIISLDIFFICLPKKTIEYFKNIFFKFNISVNKFFCSSYAKSINYKDNLTQTDYLSFIDIGFNKTSIICYVKNEIIFLDIVKIGGNHITKDISKILGINIKEAENIKLNFDKNQTFLDEKKLSLDLIKKIIFARTEEILELCKKIMESNLYLDGKLRIVLTGEGSKILNNQHKDKFPFLNDAHFFEETSKDICKSGFKFISGLNKQEVVVVPKKLTKHGFFEKFFHFFR